MKENKLEPITPIKLSKNNEPYSNYPDPVEDELATKYTLEIVCPYCLKEMSDSWEIEPDNTELDCGWCGKRFSMSRNVTVDYSTYKIKDE